MLALSELFGKRMRSLPDKNGLRFALSDRYKKNITNFVTRVLMLAAGDEKALQERTVGQANKMKERKETKA